MKTKKKAPEITTKEEYIKEFGRDIRLRKRKAIYVHPDIHGRLESIAHSLKAHNISISALATVILMRHINTHSPVLEKIINEEVDNTTTDPKRETVSGDKTEDKAKNSLA